MRTLVSLLLIALALYTVEALAQESAKQTWTAEPAGGAVPAVIDQGPKTQATVAAPGQDCDACVKYTTPTSGYYPEVVINPSGHGGNTPAAETQDVKGKK